MIKLKRFEGNPIIKPIPEHTWESKATFNPAAIYEGGKVHIVYRAMSKESTSVLGYASSSDGFHIDERLEKPVYVPRKHFEKRDEPGYFGCEDPRITKLGDRFYMCYTGFNAKNPPGVALTSIKVEDFLNKNWNWEEPRLISLSGIADKNACVLEEKIYDRYVVFHRIQHQIWIDFVDDLDFRSERRLMGTELMKVRHDKWDSEKIGIGAPPIKTKDGWLLVYHGLSKSSKKYRLGVVLLDLKHPSHVIARLDYPVLEPEAEYEKQGLRSNVVFACGAVIIKRQLFVYYGGADQVVCVATASVDEILQEVLKSSL